MFSPNLYKSEKKIIKNAKKEKIYFTEIKMSIS